MFGIVRVLLLFIISAINYDFYHIKVYHMFSGYVVKYTFLTLLHL